MAKTNDCEATLRKGNLPKASAVENAKPVAGAVKAAAKKQYAGNVGNKSAEEYGK